jgi:hypothetical protein
MSMTKYAQTHISTWHSNVIYPHLRMWLCSVMYYGMGLFHLGTRLVTIGFCEGLFHTVTNILFFWGQRFKFWMLISTIDPLKPTLIWEKKSGPIDGLPTPPKKKVVIFPKYDTKTSYKMRNMLFIEYYGVRWTGTPPHCYHGKNPKIHLGYF